MATVELDELVSIRLKRQELLYPDVRHRQPLLLDAIVDESAIRRGSGPVMRDQLEHLMRGTHQMNISIRVLPFSAAVQVPSGDFTIFEPLEQIDDAVVLIESVGEQSFRAGVDGVNSYRKRWNEIAARALDPRTSTDLIRSSLAGGETF